MKKNLFELIKKISGQLAPAYEHTAEQEQIAWWLLERVTKKNAAELLAQDEIILSESQNKELQEMIHEHVIKKKPLQYIFGTVPFNDIELLVEPPVLIPRPETEEWVCDLITHLKKLSNKQLRILDIGSGSGAISCALGHALPEAEITAIDIATEALALTKKNISHNKLTNITSLQSNLFEALAPTDRFDLIVSNPPYISSDEYKKLDESVMLWEDKRALATEHKGLYIIEKIIKHAPSYLKKNNELFHHGMNNLYIEIGYKQGRAVKELMLNALYSRVNIVKDLEKKDRVVCGTAP